MVISSNTLFHFTNSKDRLISILKNEFEPKYCLEESLLSQKKYKMKIAWAIPAVCFCDLPLSVVKPHLSVYGNYALGMTKEWGLRKGINPVIYLCRESYLTKCLVYIGDVCSKEYVISDVEAYMKPYKGTMHRGKKVYKNYKFYDEMEWRYIPQINSKAVDTKWKISPEDFFNKKRREEANLGLAQKYKLSFQPADIKYIIIKSERERLPIIEAIEEAKRKYDQATVKKVSSRILSVEQIEEDF